MGWILGRFMRDFVWFGESERLQKTFVFPFFFLREREREGE